MKSSSYAPQRGVNPIAGLAGSDIQHMQTGNAQPQNWLGNSQESDKSDETKAWGVMIEKCYTLTMHTTALLSQPP